MEGLQQFARWIVWATGAAIWGLIGFWLCVMAVAFVYKFVKHFREGIAETRKFWTEWKAKTFAERMETARRGAEYQKLRAESKGVPYRYKSTRQRGFDHSAFQAVRLCAIDAGKKAWDYVSPFRG